MRKIIIILFLIAIIGIPQDLKSITIEYFCVANDDYAGNINIQLKEKSLTEFDTEYNNLARHGDYVSTLILLLKMNLVNPEYYKLEFHSAQFERYDPVIYNGVKYNYFYDGYGIWTKDLVKGSEPSNVLIDNYAKAFIGNSHTDKLEKTLGNEKFKYYTDAKNLSGESGFIKKILTDFMFYVCDTNAFHQISYILSRYAFLRAGTHNERTKNVIINIDQHTDVHAGSFEDQIKENVGTGTWGNWSLYHHANAIIHVGRQVNEMNSAEDDRIQIQAFYKNDRNIANLLTYVDTNTPLNIQQNEGEGALAYNLRLKRAKVERDKLSKIYIAHNGNPWTQIEGFINKLQQTEILAAWNDLNFYITYDRDVHRYGGTHWAHGRRLPKHTDTIEYAKKIITGIGQKNSKLVGVDITGFPFANANDVEVRNEIKSLHGMDYGQGKRLTEETRYKINLPQSQEDKDTMNLHAGYLKALVDDITQIYTAVRDSGCLR